MQVPLYNHEAARFEVGKSTAESIVCPWCLCLPVQIDRKSNLVTENVTCRLTGILSPPNWKYPMAMLPV